MYRTEKHLSHKNLSLSLFWETTHASDFEDWQLRMNGNIIEELIPQFLTALHSYLEQAFPQVMSREGIDLGLELCDENRIRALNSQWRAKDKVTDVLSFPVHENLRIELDDIFPGPLELGDLALCVPVSIKQAKDWSGDPCSEFFHLLTHGVLHLLGYDHEVSDSEQLLMENEEKRLIQCLNQVRN
jgi:probable rRNA maturation factor